MESVDELLVTEMIFDNMFMEMEPAASCAILITMFPQDKSRRPLQISPALDKGLQRMKALAERVASVQQECQLNIDPQQYAESFQTGLMQVKSTLLRSGKTSWKAGGQSCTPFFSATTTSFCTQTTYDWCSGKSFPECCAHTDIFEGTVIRLLRRLEELLRELSAAAGGIGNAELQAQFDVSLALAPVTPVLSHLTYFLDTYLFRRGVGC